MSFYVATLGELLIVEAFVFFIWLKVFFNVASVKPDSLESRKILITSIGLLLTSLAVFGIIVSRVLELVYEHVYIIAITSFYVTLSIGNFMFMIAAAIENSFSQIKLFILITILWSMLYLFSSL